MYNIEYMGSQLVVMSKTEKSGLDYRIYNIDNVYTLYIKIDTQPNPENGVLEPIYSAIKSFSTLKEAKEYAKKI